MSSAIVLAKCSVAYAISPMDLLRSKLITKTVPSIMHRQATNHTIGKWGIDTDFLFEKFETFFAIIDKLWYFVTHFSELVNIGSIKLLTGIFSLISQITCQIPTFLFGSFLSSTTLKLSLVAMGLTVILVMFESIKQMVGMRKEPVEVEGLTKRLFVATTVTGFAPFLFSTVFGLINKLCMGLVSINAGYMKAIDPKQFLALGDLNVWILLGFDILLIRMLFPVIVQNGKRWFNLLWNACLTPFAMSCWAVTDSHNRNSISGKYFNNWWYSIKKLSLQQIQQTMYILLIGLLMFSSSTFTMGTGGIGGFLAKLMVMIGGLHKLANPSEIEMDRSKELPIDKLTDMFSFKKAKDYISFDKNLAKIKKKFKGGRKK